MVSLLSTSYFSSFSAVYLLVRLAQQALDAQQHTLSVQSRAPRALLALSAGLQDVEADAAAHVNVGVVDRGLEEDFRRSVRVVGREGEGELEGERVVWCVGWAKQGCVPVGEVGCGEGRDAGCGRGHEGHEFGLQAVRETLLEICLVVWRFEDWLYRLITLPLAGAAAFEPWTVEGAVEEFMAETMELCRWRG